MECQSTRESATCGEESASSARESAASVGEEEGEGGWLTSTPQPTRRPLHQLNTASPRTQLTPYRYHGCKAIPEEREDQENIDPSVRGARDATVNTKSSVMSPENSTTHTNSGSESSPFAYPLIWEANHSTATPQNSTQQHTAPHSTTSSSSSDGSKSHSAGDTSAWRSPISHLREEKTVSAYNEQVKGGSEGMEGQQEGQEGSRKVRNRSGSSNDASNCKVACHHGPLHTPSKATHTHHTHTNTSTVFLTPSSSMYRPGGGECRGGGGGGGQTPKHQPITFSTSNLATTSHHTNPFEVGAESLYLSAVSPSLFQQVVSPSQKVDANFRWSIDQMAELQPVNIETSPFNQMEAAQDPDYEKRIQDAIDRFFTTHQSVIPSPWTGSNKSVSVVKKMCVPPSHASPSLPPPRTQSVWCQTEMTLPPILPPALEEALRPFCSFTQNQGWQGPSEGDESAGLNNTTLRRKLLFSREDLAANAPYQGGKDPSSPSTSSSYHSASRSPKQAAEKQQEEKEEEEEEESGLVWCTAVLEPGTRHSSNSATVSSSCTPTQASHRPGTLLLDTPGTDLISPEVSPIHLYQYSSDLETKLTSPGSAAEVTYLEHPHVSQGTEKDNWIRSVGIRHSSPPSSQEPLGGEEVHMGTQDELEEEEHIHKSVNLSESFSCQFPDKDVKLKSPVTSSPTAELRCSTNSGHFSSSPIQEVFDSPLQVDSPSDRFSSSPLLSPIFCRPLLFPTQPSANIKERKPDSELVMMEESEDESESGVECGVAPIITTTTTTLLPQLPHCSSLCDMEMDSHPSVEINFGDEAASQDTGYQTASSLLPNDYSCTTFLQ